MFGGIFPNEFKMFQIDCPWFKGVVNSEMVVKMVVKMVLIGSIQYHFRLVLDILDNVEPTILNMIHAHQNIPNDSILLKVLSSLTLFCYASTQMILKSTKLFVTTEWQVYKALCIWLYLHLNPKQDILPAWSTIVSFFANYTGSDFVMPPPIKTV